MPILDSSDFAGSDALPDFLRCDICIIGTGPAGATIARELSNTPLRVTILESGGTERQEETDALNEIESVGWPRVMDQWLVRNRIVGGTSNTWSGRCAPFDESGCHAPAATRLCLRRSRHGRCQWQETAQLANTDSAVSGTGIALQKN